MSKGARHPCPDPGACGVQWHRDLSNCRAPAADRAAPSQAATRRVALVPASSGGGGAADMDLAGIMEGAGAAPDDVDRLMAMPWMDGVLEVPDKDRRPMSPGDSPWRHPRERAEVMGRIMSARPGMPSDELCVWWSMAGWDDPEAAVSASGEQLLSPADAWADGMMRRARAVPRAPLEATHHGMQVEARRVAAGVISRGGAEDLDEEALKQLGAEPPRRRRPGESPYDGWNRPPNNQFQAYWRLMEGSKRYYSHIDRLPGDSPNRRAMAGSKDGLMQWGGLWGQARIGPWPARNLAMALSGGPDDGRARMVVDWRLGSLPTTTDRLARYIWSDGDGAAVERRFAQVLSLHRSHATGPEALAAVAPRY